MNYYTESIPPTLAKILKEKGMPIETEGNNVWCPSYAECLDWLMSEKEIFISLPPIGKLEDGSYRYEATIAYDDATDEEYLGGYSWHEAADAAIEKALTLI